jgi:hypothetical protein
MIKLTAKVEIPERPPRPMKSKKWLRRRNKKWFRSQNFLNNLCNSFADRIALDWEDMLWTWWSREAMDKMKKR